MTGGEQLQLRVEVPKNLELGGTFDKSYELRGKILTNQGRLEL